MPYFAVDDGFAFHRKAVQAGNAAIGLWTRAGSWCSLHLTDGFVPAEIVTVLGTRSQAARLVRAGLWVEVDGGFQFHDWTENGRNFSRQQVLERRQKERDKKAHARSAKSAKQQVNEDCPQETPEGFPGGVPGGVRSTHPIPSQEEKKKTSSSSTRARGTRIPEDFAVSPAMVDWARAKTPAVDGRTETEKFRDYWQARDDKAAVKRDWVAAWRNWMRSAQERLDERRQRNSGFRPSTTDRAVAQAELLKTTPDPNVLALGASTSPVPSLLMIQGGAAS